jgi:hypothetical protein
MAQVFSPKSLFSEQNLEVPFSVVPDIFSDVTLNL